MKKIKYLVMDVDGTLTDGMIYVGHSGELCKGFYVKDGLGIKKIIEQNGIEPMILTSRESDIVVQRCMELGIDSIYQGVRNKKEKLEEIMQERKITSEELAYIADDVNDLEALKLASFRACPNDAVFEIRNVCNFVSHYNGGHGAVRELCDYLCR